MDRKTTFLGPMRLRPATADDFAFARRLYFASMQPLLTRLGVWDAAKTEAVFKEYFDVDEISIVNVEDTDIGWIQISKTDEELCLDQIHLIAEMRNKGLGEKLVKRVMAEAFSQNKAITLSVIRGNPSINLYKRLGFQLTGEDETKFHMRCEPFDPAPLGS